MSKRYPGNFITGNPVALSQTSNNGIWDLKDQYQAHTNSTWQEVDGVYEIAKSLRFRSAAGTYLTKSFAADGNRRTYTWSFWVKRGKIGSDQHLWSSASTGHPGGADIAYIGFTGDDRFVTYMYPNGGPAAYYVGTSRVFRDCSAWYHIVLRHDTSAATTTDRVKIYVNGVEEFNLSNASYPSLNYASSYINSTRPQVIAHEDGRWRYPFDGYMAESNFIDGQALDASYFGYFDPITNIWQPKKYTGTYGTNGFYFPFTEPVATSGTVNNQVVTRNFAGGTNYVRASENGNGTGWVIERATVAVNDTVAPDGTTTANKLTSDGTSSNTHRTYATCVATPAGSTQTTSIYLKYSNCRYINIENWNGSSFQTQTFDILNGVAVTGFQTAVGFTSQFVGNGWYRVSVPLYAGSANTGGPSVAIYLLDASGNVTWNGDSTSSVYYWGAQLNLGTTPDAYVKTTGTALFNDWTPNGISVTAGSTYDIMVDSPVNVFTSATDTGGVVSGNYCTFNPVDIDSSITLSNANLTASASTGVHNNGRMTISTGISGFWYMEFTYASSISGSTAIALGLYSPQFRVDDGTHPVSATSGFYGMYGSTTSYMYTNGSTGASVLVSTGSAGNTLQLAYDVAGGKLWYGLNNAWYDSSGGTTGNPSTGANPTITGVQTNSVFGYDIVSNTININFGQRTFAYTPPTGFKSLNTTNLQALGSSTVAGAGVQPHKWFDINLSAGTTVPRRVSGLQFQPDLVWFKCRDGSTNRRWSWFDSVRGPNAHLTSQNAEAEIRTQTDLLTSFNSDGFNVGADAGLYGANGISERWAHWAWKQSPAAGLNIVSYTGNGANNRAISHNLGVVPEFIIVKDRDIGYNWDIYHKNSGISATFTFTTDGTRNASAFGSTAPTSSNFFTQNNYTNTNNSRMIAYVWAGIPGFSKFDAYVGNSSSDGTFVHTGFRPKFVLVKQIVSGANWQLYDAVRSRTNPAYHNLRITVNDSEDSNYAAFDFLSNGFKLRHDNSVFSINAGGTSFIYAAFAESPFALNNRAR